LAVQTDIQTKSTEPNGYADNIKILLVINVDDGYMAYLTTVQLSSWNLHIDPI